MSTSHYINLIIKLIPEIKRNPQTSETAVLKHKDTDILFIFAFLDCPSVNNWNTVLVSSLYY